MDSAVYQPFPMLPGRRAQAWRHQPAYRRPRHFHEEPEINLVLRGQARLGVGAAECVVGPGNVLFFHAGQDHVLLEASEDLELFVVALTPELASRVARSRTPAPAFRAALPAAELERLEPILFGVGDVAGHEVVETRLASVFELALSHLFGGHAATRRAHQHLLRDPEVPASTLARRVGASVSGLSRTFHEDFRVPLVEMRSRIRLIRFIQRVDAGSDLLRASSEAGFGSYAQCHRVFRRFLGCSPKAYFAGARLLVDGACCLWSAEPSSDQPPTPGMAADAPSREPLVKTNVRRRPLPRPG